jgi:hypothetical protein
MQELVLALSPARRNLCWWLSSRRVCYHAIEPSRPFSAWKPVLSGVPAPRAPLLARGQCAVSVARVVVVAAAAAAAAASSCRSGTVCQIQPLALNPRRTRVALGHVDQRAPGRRHVALLVRPSGLDGGTEARVEAQAFGAQQRPATSEYSAH